MNIPAHESLYVILPFFSKSWTHYIYHPNLYRSYSIAGIIGKILMSFSVPHNASKIMSTARLPSSLDAVHGIRFISMSWVILGHTYFFILGSICEYLGHPGSHILLYTGIYLWVSGSSWVTHTSLYWGLSVSIWVILGHTYFFILGSICEYLGHHRSHTLLYTEIYLWLWVSGSS